MYFEDLARSGRGVTPEKQHNKRSHTERAVPWALAQRCPPFSLAERANGHANILRVLDTHDVRA